MNYKITFKLKTPVAVSDTIMFDGLVAYAFAQESSKFNNGRLSISKDDMIDLTKMPIVYNKEEDYFFASWMLYDVDGAVEHLGSWKKRWANENDEYADFGKNIRKVRINNADYKSYNMPIRLVDLGECYFYFQSNDVDEVRRLIETHIVGLGKKVSQGNGVIESFEIEESEYMFDNIIRPMPITKLTPNVVTRYIGFKPPYWLPENQKECIVSKSN